MFRFWTSEANKTKNTVERIDWNGDLVFNLNHILLLLIMTAHLFQCERRRKEKLKGRKATLNGDGAIHLKKKPIKCIQYSNKSDYSCCDYLIPLDSIRFDSFIQTKNIWKFLTKKCLYFEFKKNRKKFIIKTLDFW